MPHLQALAARSEVGRANVIPGDLPPGSDVGNLSILGYDPEVFHTGRAPIEAAAMGIDLGPDEVASGASRHHRRRRGRWSTSRPDTSPTRRAIRSSPRYDDTLGDGRDRCGSMPVSSTAISFVVPGDWADADCVPSRTTSPASPRSGRRAPRRPRSRP